MPFTLTEEQKVYFRDVLIPGAKKAGHITFDEFIKYSYKKLTQSATIRYHGLDEKKLVKAKQSALQELDACVQLFWRDLSPRTRDSAPASYQQGDRIK